jgi:hydroxymethylbilane synthase
MRPDLKVDVLRGNVQTRLGKLDSGEFDGIILACAGLIRLDMHDRIKQEMNPVDMLPGAGQGVLGVEYRSDETEMGQRIRALVNADVAACVKAERAVNRRLGASCTVPVAAFAEMDGPGQIWLRARIVSPRTNKILHAEGRAPAAEADILGENLANELLGQGGDAILTELGISV